MHEILLVRDHTESQTLADVAGRVYRALSLDVTEERESSNYVDGHYFVGHACNVAVKVCLGDGAEMPEYRYWVVLATQVLRSDVRQQIASEPEVIAAQLAETGFDVFLPSRGFGRVDWDSTGVHFPAATKNA